MYIGGLSPYANKIRFSGLSGSGLDTDELVSQLMLAERIPYDKLFQKRQLTEWKRESYRDITNLLRGFKDSFFNALKPTSNMLSASAYKKYTYNSSDDKVVSVTANADASAGNHKIKVDRIATAAVNVSSAGVTKQITGSSQIFVDSAKGKSITLELDGTAKTITVGNDVTDVSGVVASLQQSIDDAFGTGKAVVGTITDAEGKVLLTIRPVEGSGVNKLAVSSGPDESKDALMALGFSGYTTNRLSTGETLEAIASKMSVPFAFNADGKISLTINGKSFEFDKTDTLGSMINKINTDPTANVNFQYDEVKDVFKITAKQMGMGTSIRLSETGSTFLSAANLAAVTGTGTAAGAYQDYSLANKSFSVVIDGVAKDITLDGNYSAYTSSDLKLVLESKIEAAFIGRDVTLDFVDGRLSLSVADGTLSIGEPSTGASALEDLGLLANYFSGQDASVILDGQKLTRSSNTFTVSGVTYTLLKESPEEQTVSLSLDTNGIYENIKSFVEKYNEVIKKINDELAEEYDRNYLPLTAEQKESMNEDDIKRWEEKAKTGLLRHDSLLQGIVYDMRKALTDKIDGMDISLSSIGITTGTYEEKGKLIIDEHKLKDAIQKNPEAVMNLFSKKSDIGTNIDLTSEERAERYKEEGLAYRLYDIIENNIRTTRDKNDKKGLLLEKAGIPGDLSDVKSSLSEEIAGYDKDLLNLQIKLYEKENDYYLKFARLESILAQMNSQSASIMAQLGQL